MASHVIVVGGAGYVGSHTCCYLASQGFIPVVIDNFIYGHRDFVQWGPVVEGDIADQELMRQAIRQYQPVAVFHFAAFTYVGESVQQPIRYYMNNVVGTLRLLEVMVQENVKHFVFSSTCATYGNPQTPVLAEDHPQKPLNPYGSSKLMVEQILHDLDAAHGLKSVCLRYFNASGADPDAQIGEHHEPESHLIPLLLDVAMGRRQSITVFGNDYPTPDGTCVRDYIHVLDLAQAHVKALTYLQSGKPSTAFNLGNGNGFSVQDVISVVEKVTGKQIPIVMGERRDGDAPALVANFAKAKSILDWQPEYADLETIVRHAWAWHQKRFGS